MGYAVLDNNGKVTGRIAHMVSGTEPPLDDATWQKILAGNDAVWDGSTYKLSPTPAAAAAPLAVVQAGLCRDIDIASERQRLKYITPGAGQAAVYVEKAKQADAYKAAGYPAIVAPSPYPLLTDEAQATNVTEQTLADAVIAQRNAWLSLAAQIEAARIKGKNDVKAATDAATAVTARDTAIAALAAI